MSDDSEIKRSGVELTSELIGKDKNKYKQIIVDNIKYENLLEIAERHGSEEVKMVEEINRFTHIVANKMQSY